MSLVQHLALDDNLITGQGCITFVNACKPRGEHMPLPRLEHVDFDGNEIGKTALTQLGAALKEDGILPRLRILEVDDEWVDLPALRGVCDQRRITVR